MSSEAPGRLVTVGVTAAVVLGVLASIVVTFLPWPFGPLSGACADVAARTRSLPGEDGATVLDVTGDFSAFPLGVECTVTSSSGLVSTTPPGWTLTVVIVLALAAGIVVLARVRVSRAASPTDG